MTKKLLIILIAVLAMTSSIANAQTVVSGKVLEDASGEPMVGASVTLQNNSAVGTVTDVEGNFTFTIPAGKGSMLKVTYVGMKTETVKGGKNIVVRMKADDALIGEVVVTGMSNMDRRLFTGSTDKLDADKTMISGMNDISRSLEGRSAGVSVQNVSGTFGSAPKIRVRGATSIYGSSKPLWVVDGVILEDVTDISADDLASGDAETLISSAIAGLNSDDIESFQVLKDGSATSIYGARAMAGVIVVTTKKGRSGQATISYSGEFTSRLIPSYSQFNILDSREQMGIYKEMQQKGWLNMSSVLNGSNYGVYGKMYELMNTYNSTTGQFALQATQEAEYDYLRAQETRNTNWFKELFSSDIMMNHSMSLSGGTQKSNYYVSMSYLSDSGWYTDSEVKRYTANFNASHNVLKNLTMTVLGNASYRKQKAPGTLGKDVDVVSGEVSRDFDINPYSYALNSSRTLDPDEYYVANYSPFNIKHELETNYIDLNVIDAKFQAELKYKPIQDLELKGIAAVKYASTSQQHNIEDSSNQALAYRAMGTSQIRDNNIYLYSDPDDPYALPISVLPEGGIYYKTTNVMRSYDYRFTANYNHTFDNTHIINILAGAESTRIERQRDWFTGWGMQYDSGEIPFYTYQYFKKIIEENNNYYSLSNTNSRSAALLANGTYSYKGRYVLNGTYRYEGSNQLGRNSSARWLPTWNIAGAWNASEESWWGKSLGSWMSHATVKASYSLTASPPDASIVSSTTVFTANTPYRLFSSDKETGIGISSLGDDDLTYEKKNELNLGLDLGFLNDRITLATDVYWRKNFDEIGPVVTNGASGQVVRYANRGDMSSNGVEVSIASNNIKTKNFTWHTDFIFSYNNTKITNLNNQARVIDLVTGTGYGVEGYPCRALFSIPFQGLNEDGMPTFINEKNELTVCDINFQERDNISYLKYEGSTDPKYVGSLGNTFTWKGLSLNIFMTYSFGNVVRLDPVFSATYNDLISMTKEFKNRWVQPGDEKYTNVPVILSYRQYHDNTQLRYAYNAYNYSSERIAKGDFIRMKEIALSYQFPKSLLKSTPFNSASLKIQATNLFLIYADSKLNGQDPEFINAGGVASPVPRQFTLTAKFSL